jgi:hypothetical protein
MDNAQNCDSYINVPSSQTYDRPYFLLFEIKNSHLCEPHKELLTDVSLNYVLRNFFWDEVSYDYSKEILLIQ